MAGRGKAMSRPARRRTGRPSHIFPDLAHNSQKIKKKEEQKTVTRKHGVKGHARHLAINLSCICSVMSNPQTSRISRRPDSPRLRCNQPIQRLARPTPSPRQHQFARASRPCPVSSFLLPSRVSRLAHFHKQKVAGWPTFVSASCDCSGPEGTPRPSLVCRVEISPLTWQP
jgi:hypothetical protein